MRFAKPLDGRLIQESLDQTPFLFTLEEHVLTGGFGSKVLEFLEEEGLEEAHVKRIALPDEFIEQGSREVMFERFGLSPERVASRVLEVLRNPKNRLLTSS